MNTESDFLSGGGKTGKYIRDHNWSLTSLGPVKSWPQSLRSVVSICLNVDFPVAICWGKGWILLYNDAWNLIADGKHSLLGKSAKEVWPEIWKGLELPFQQTFDGKAGSAKNVLLPVHHYGLREERCFNVTFTPVTEKAEKQKEYLIRS